MHNSDDDPLDAAFAAVPRAGFLPDNQRRHSGDDQPLSIGFGQTNSQPTTVRNMLRLLDARPGQRVLDVGSGSGWTTALLAHLVGPHGLVYGVEIVPELVELAQPRLARLDLSWTTIEAADPDVLGLPRRAPFDRILVSAEYGFLPPPLVDQLASGGRMVMPVSGRLQVVDRDASGALEVEHVGHYAFVPLLWDG